MDFLLIEEQRAADNRGNQLSTFTLDQSFAVGSALSPNTLSLMHKESHA